MRRTFATLLIATLIILIFGSLSGEASSEAMITVTGTVNTDYEIVTDDGQVYEVVENLKGKEVVELIDRKVRVTGSVTEKKGVKRIRIASYEVID